MPACGTCAVAGAPGYRDGQNLTSGEFGVPTSTERAFFVEVDYFRSRDSAVDRKHTPTALPTSGIITPVPNRLLYTLLRYRG